MIQRIRDEAHRFAITYQRKRTYARHLAVLGPRSPGSVRPGSSDLLQALRFRDPVLRAADRDDRRGQGRRPDTCRQIHEQLTVARLAPRLAQAEATSPDGNGQRTAGGAGRHRDVRRWSVDRWQRARRPRLVRRRQPSAADASSARRPGGARGRVDLPEDRRDRRHPRWQALLGCAGNGAEPSRRTRECGCCSSTRPMPCSCADSSRCARPHPAAGRGHPPRRNRAERTRMEEIRETSDIVIDTSELNIHQLATTIAEKFSESKSAGVQVTIVSFGFKYGLPADADMVADMRFLPNPFWIPELRPLTGLDPEVSEYVSAQEGAREFVDALRSNARPGARRLPAREQETRYDRHWVHGRKAPLGGCRRRVGISAAQTRSSPSTSNTATSAASSSARTTTRSHGSADERTGRTIGTDRRRQRRTSANRGQQDHGAGGGTRDHSPVRWRSAPHLGPDRG